MNRSEPSSVRGCLIKSNPLIFFFYLFLNRDVCRLVSQLQMDLASLKPIRE